MDSIGTRTARGRPVVGESVGGGGSKSRSPALRALCTCALCDRKVNLVRDLKMIQLGAP